jgi:hypothetical protein
MVMDKKHMLVVAACVVAIGLLIGVSAAFYSHYKHEQQVSANQANQVLAAEAKSQENAKKVFAYQLYLLKLNCAHDIAVNRTAKKPLPICDSNLQMLQ